MRRYKILQINTVCDHGSIPGIMRNISSAVERDGGCSEIAYGRREAPAGTNAYRFGNGLDLALHIGRNFVLGQSGFGSKKPTERLISHIRENRPDLIHLHNIHGFFLNVEAFFSFLKATAIPVIWTLHDCWPYTGQCAYYSSAHCDKWRTGCHDCPIYRSEYPYSIFKDNSRDNYHRKKAAFTGVPGLEIVTPSKWLCDEVGQSFLKEYPVKVIYNGVRTDVFYPTATDMNTPHLDSFSVSADKKILLGVANIWEARKGLNDILKLSDALGDSFQTVIVGLSQKQIRDIKSAYPADRVLPLKRTDSVDELRELYGLADVFINPTSGDNLPTTNLEALACGTPVVTYRTGGSAECIDEKTGVAVEVGDIEGLSNAIRAALRLSGDDCSARAAQIFDAEHSADSYIRLYREMMTRTFSRHQSH